ncbi:cysteine-rich receptor-like protein kinase 40 [Bidens hawaiensis]|uniref:cysteine-rich receptor-like protein kinase 40 n=1 Tax=Bidens hawaiensis TaxID=980011 RepID=UPI004049A594
MKHLQIPLQDIVLATNEFTEQNLIDDSGKIYRGKSKKHGHIVIHRLGLPIDLREFELEIALLSERKHENIFSLLGYCSEGGEKILVYKDESKGTLDEYLDSEDLSWDQRLRICQDVGRGLSYLNDDVDRIIHRDFKSSNIFLDVDRKPKVLSFRPKLYRYASFITKPFAPPYLTKGDLTQKSAVYSFGVVLWEVLCGKRLITSDKDDP